MFVTKRSSPTSCNLPPSRSDHFAEGESPDQPFLVFLSPSKEIEMTLEDGTRKPFSFEANGATAILYRMVFHEDLMVTMNNLSSADLDTLVGAKLAYIMHAQAEGTPTSQLSLDDFIHWVEGFDGVITEFDENLWSSLVDHVTVMKDKKVIFTFKGGTEIET